MKLDFGCGKNPREGFEGVDVRDFGQKHVMDLTTIWPWEDNSVEEAHSSHFVEHLTAPERIHFVNELYRVLVPGVFENGKPTKGFATVVVPHWASCRAYGDLTHQWPPVSEFWFYYLDKNWRADNAPHNDGYTCDFNCSWGYSMHQGIASRNQEYQIHAMTFWKEACQDTIATLVTRKG